MASPFSVFRKRQKLMMAILCLMAMIAFVILPNLNLGGGKSRGAKNLAVVKTKTFGDLYQSDMKRLRENRQKVRAVLTELRQAAGQEPKKAQDEVNAVIGPVTEEALVDTWLKVRRAQEMGMVVNDETVNRFLQQWTVNRVKIADFQTAFKRTPPVTEVQFFDLLRDDLLARQLVDTFAPSVEVAGRGNEIRRPVALGQRRGDRRLDRLRGGRLAQRPAQHHRPGQDRRQRIGDVSAGDVRRGTVDRLVQAVQSVGGATLADRG